ncbi:MAG: magnesium-translocating P-type ATPase [Verrucomicrobia bacterium]|nr:magnesium-translocating P-type ATPase [Verrucomicrobiota bacterium]
MADQTGLSSQEAARRLREFGLNSLKGPARGRGISLFIAQFKSPLILLLIGAALLSFALKSHLDASIILAIVLLSGLLGFYQERGAISALEKLLQLVENKAAVVRDGQEVEISLERVVPGDLIVLRAGDLVPADCSLLESKNLFVDESTMTGESLPVEKEPSNDLFLGTMVSSGFGTAVAQATGKNTKFASMANKIQFRPPETAFEIGVKKFGQFLLALTLILVVAIFAVNVILQKDIVQTFLFSVALAVGFTPQLLPAIIAVNLSHGARRMAQKKVIVKRLASIENFGQMNILCSDKTGTITVGKLRFEGAFGTDGNPSDKALFYGYLNAKFQAGYANPLDQSLLDGKDLDSSGWEKIDEIPYDFNRKRLSVIFRHESEEISVDKGAFSKVLEVCSQVEKPDGSIEPLESCRKDLERIFEEKSQEGFRILGLAYGKNGEEKNLVFLGFLCFYDPIKPDIGAVIEQLKKKGVSLKIITGDHPAVAAHAAACLGLDETAMINGDELEGIDDAAFLEIVKEKNIFAQIDPNKKERIILSLRKAGFVVGYLGDGINDVAALHNADVGIAVDSGADAAKEAADIVLLEKNLSVLQIGIEEGRKTFVNTLKYVYMATSANFGNMFSMAGVSLFLNFLPLLPKQVLLTNFFSDLSEMTLATDSVDKETIERPVKWDLKRIQSFMVVFGLLNSIADFLTFGVLLFWFQADENLFRSGWFIENVVSAALVVLCIRTQRFCFRSKPGKLLCISVFVIALGIPWIAYTPLGTLFGLVPIPLSYYAPLIAIILIYLFSVELTKFIFFKTK